MLRSWSPTGTCHGVKRGRERCGARQDMPNNSTGNTPQPSPGRSGSKASPGTPGTKPYKYAGALGAVPDCPHQANAKFDGPSYRVVHSDLRNPMNFRPNAALWPGYYDHQADKRRCESWALSMFEKREQLKKHLRKMQKSNPMWHKLVGDHGVKLAVTDAHGRRSAAGTRGHFSFYEYSDFEAAAVIEEHFPLMP